MGRAPYGIGARSVLLSRQVSLHLIQKESAMTIPDLLIAVLILLLFATLRFGVPLFLMWLGKTIHNRMLHLQP